MVVAKDTALIERVRRNLEILYLQLEVVQSGVITAANALRYQNVEHDADVASVLQYGVGDRLSVQLECVAEMIREFPAAVENDNAEEAEPSLQ
jgi:hypothetical protein